MAALIKTVLVTGANVGLGYEAARQLALKKGVTKIILGCRNPDKALAAKKSLEATTNSDGAIFETLIIDVSNLDSVRKAVEDLKEPIDGLIMNAGGPGANPLGMTKYGVVEIFALNVLGHAFLVDLLLEQKKLTGAAVYAGSEAARGIPSMGFKKYEFKSGSVDEFANLVNGSAEEDSEAMYGISKLVAAMWMSSMARKEPSVRFVTMSPGGTAGTAIASDMSAVKKFMTENVGFPLLKALGKVHTVDIGAKRYVDALLEEDKYKSGVFYASEKGMAGPTVDQVVFADYFANELFQDHANEAIHKFLPKV